MQIFSKVFRFILFGIPAFLIAIPLNWFLVETLLWPKPAAYALVLVVQVVINFFICIHFVFDRDPNKKLANQFIIFMTGILIARVLDWGLYSILVQTTPIHYIAIQFFNVIVFSLAKFSFARRTIEGKGT